MRRLTGMSLLLAIALSACGGTAPPAEPARNLAATQTTLRDLTLSTSTVALGDLNATTADRYGIDRSRDGVLVLVTVRDAAGNAVAADGLQLTATASALPDPSKPLELRAIQTDGMTDYIGVFHAAGPATVRFGITATHEGARADIVVSRDLPPR